MLKRSMMVFLPVHRTCCEPRSTGHQRTPRSPAPAAAPQPAHRFKQSHSNYNPTSRSTTDASKLSSHPIIDMSKAWFISCDRLKVAFQSIVFFSAQGGFSEEARITRPPPAFPGYHPGVPEVDGSQPSSMSWVCPL